MDAATQHEKPGKGKAVLRPVHGSGTPGWAPPQDIPWPPPAGSSASADRVDVGQDHPADPTPQAASSALAAALAASVTVSPASIRASSSTRASSSRGTTVVRVWPFATRFSTRQ